LVEIDRGGGWQICRETKVLTPAKHQRHHHHFPNTPQYLAETERIAMENDSEGGAWKLGMAFICTGILFVLSCGVASVVYYADRPMCPPPPTLENGAFHISGNGTIKAGFVAHYKCNPGFQIGETKSLTCQLWNSGGIWAPDDPPVVCTSQ